MPITPRQIIHLFGLAGKRASTKQAVVEFQRARSIEGGKAIAEAVKNVLNRDFIQGSVSKRMLEMRYGIGPSGTPGTAMAHSVIEIAHRFGVTPNRVYQQLNAAKRKIRRRALDSLKAGS